MSNCRPLVEMVITHLALGGAENVALSIVEALHDSFAFEVFVVLKQNSDSAIGQQMATRLYALDVPIRFGTKRSFKRGGAIEAAWNLRRRLAARRPALVHVHTEIPELTLAVATALPSTRGRVPLVRTIHNVELWPNWGKIGAWVEKRLANASIAGVSMDALKASERTFASTRATVSPDNQRVLIYNGVREIQQSPRVPKGDVVRILFAGRFEWQKGADLLAGILKRAEALSPMAAEVTIAGSGSLERQMKADLADVRPRWPTQIIGAIPNLAEQISRFDIVLVPSRFEGLGLVAVEALLAGLPVVATRAPGLLEVVPANDPLSADIDDVEGLAQCIAIALSDLDGARRRIVDRLPDLRARFGIAQMRDRYDMLYRAMMDCR